MNQGEHITCHTEAGKWQKAPGTLSLQKNSIHVWKASLEQSDKRIAQFTGTLSPDERERSARFYSLQDRHRYISARAILRDILSRYLKTDPEALHFSYSPQGKPEISGHLNGQKLSFNLSHAGDLSLYAFTVEDSIGIDLEHIRYDFDWQDIAERFFSLNEKKFLKRLPDRDRTLWFYRFWTRKEACLKAQGTGLTVDLDTIDVAHINDASAGRTLSCRDGSSRQWSLHDLHPKEGYIGTLAVEGTIDSLSCWQWH